MFCLLLGESKMKICMSVFGCKCQMFLTSLITTVKTSYLLRLPSNLGVYNHTWVILRQCLRLTKVLTLFIRIVLL